MKITASVLFTSLATPLVSGFAFVPTGSVASRGSTTLDAVNIYYSTSTGNTETCAGYIASASGLSMEDIGDVKDSEITSLDGMIVGAPTWHTGADEQRSGTSWDDWLYKTLPGLDVKDKKVAIFGCGDQQGYGDNYCDAAGELYDLFKAKGCKIYGMTSQDGYDHTASKAVVEGKFCGLMFDEDNQYDLSEQRAKDWVEQLKSEGFFE